MTGARTTRSGARVCGLIVLILCVAVWSPETLSRSVGRGAAATLHRDAERCRAHSALDACDDAVRRNPRDPALLVALGDALERANRPTEAIRAYRRAAVLAPNFQGVAARINAAEVNASAGHASGNRAASLKHASNADPVAQSH